jgi:hypothetical protein
MLAEPLKILWLVLLELSDSHLFADLTTNFNKEQGMK